MNQEQHGIVYVLTNPSMPGLVKIGKTSRESVLTRLQELYSTGVPVPFECAYAGKVEDESKVERAFHEAFGPYRINPKREFFMIEPEQAIALLSLLTSEDVTPAIQHEADDVDKNSKDGSNRLKKRRPNLNFEEMGIPIGSQLQFYDGDDTAVVISSRRVSMNEQDYSLTALTRKVLNISHDVAPAKFWLYNGRTILDIYNETYDALS